jgi:hypothetical protein
MAMDEQLRAALVDRLAASPCVSLRALARSAGVEPSTLSRFARGKQDIGLSAASRLAGILGLVLVPAQGPTQQGGIRRLDPGEVTRRARAALGHAQSECHSSGPAVQTMRK